MDGKVEKRRMDGKEKENGWEEKDMFI